MREDIKKFFLGLTEKEQTELIELMKVKHDKNKLSRRVSVGQGKEEREPVLGFPGNAKGEPCPLLQARSDEFRLPNFISNRGNLDFLQAIPQKVR